MKDNNICSLVRDLLPLSHDALTGSDSEQLIQAHLQTCAACRDYDASLREQSTKNQCLEDRQGQKLKRLLLRYRYETIGFVSGILIVIVVLLLCIGGLFVRSRLTEDDAPVREHFTQTTDYGSQNYTGISELALFPNSDDLLGQPEDFYYDCKGNSLYQEYQIYLKMTYTPEQYAAQKDRLCAICNDETGIPVVFTEEEFDLPAVYAMLYDEGYEYALFSDADATIEYIYLQGIDRRNLYFDESKLPKDYGQYGLPFESEREVFRIYPTEVGGQ